MTSSTQIPAPIFTEPEKPIRSELFSVERLEQHAESLAAAQTVVSGTEEGRPLIPRVMENGRILLEYYRAIARAIQHEQSITPAAEWLVDNFYIVEEQLREIRDDLAARLLPQTPQARLRPSRRVSRASSASLGHLSRTPTAVSIPRYCAASSPPTSACNRSPSENSGPWPSPCASCWWKICAGSPNAWSSAATRASKPIFSPTACWAPAARWRSPRIHSPPI